MAIYTRYGSPIKIIAYEDDSGEVTFQHEDGKKEYTLIHNLKADKGFMEIREAIRRLIEEGE